MPAEMPTATFSDVVHHQRGAGEQAGTGAQVLAGDGVGAAIARIGLDGLPVGKEQDEQQDQDRDGDRHDLRQAGGAERQQDGQRRFRAVGGGGQRVQAHGRDALDLGDLLAADLGVGEAAAEQSGQDRHAVSRLCGSNVRPGIVVAARRAGIARAGLWRHPEGLMLPAPWNPRSSRIRRSCIARRCAGRTGLASPCGSCRTSSITSTCRNSSARAIRGRARRTRTCWATPRATTATASGCGGCSTLTDAFGIRCTVSLNMTVIQHYPGHPGSDGEARLGVHVARHLQHPLSLGFLAKTKSARRCWKAARSIAP